MGREAIRPQSFQDLQEPSPGSLDRVYDALEELALFGLPFTVLGLTSLILLSKRYYRPPNDLDIMVGSQHILPFLGKLNSSWQWDLNYKHEEVLKAFVEGRDLIYAGPTPPKCRFDESSSALFAVSHSGSFACVFDPAPLNIPPVGDILFAIHSPHLTTDTGEPFCQLHEDGSFTLWVATNQVARHREVLVIFYDTETGSPVKVVQSMWHHDGEVRGKVLAFWCSPRLSLSDYGGLFYRVRLGASLLNLRWNFRHRISRLTLDLWCSRERQNFPQGVCVDYAYPSCLDNAIYTDILGFTLKVNNPHHVLHMKCCYNREKDLADAAFYADLLGAYPIISEPDSTTDSSPEDSA